MWQLRHLRETYAVPVGLKGVLHWVILAPSSKCFELHAILRKLHNLVNGCKRQNVETLPEFVGLSDEALLVLEGG